MTVAENPPDILIYLEPVFTVHPVIEYVLLPYWIEHVVNVEATDIVLGYVM